LSATTRNFLFVLPEPFLAAILVMGFEPGQKTVW
jgi:hypothetical protein